MRSNAAPRRPIGLALLLVVAGAAGLLAAFALTVDKFEALENPGAALSCDFSVLVQCSTNLASAQGAVFGFPNPLIGLVGFGLMITVGVGILAGARFTRWFWVLLQLGLTAAMAFVAWLIGQSVYVLGTLCPWCLVVWAAVIPMFLAVTLHNVRSGALGVRGRVRRVLGGAYAWVPFLTLLAYILVAVLAQFRLDLLRHL